MSTLAPVPAGPPNEWDANTLSAAIHARAISCRELMQACLAQVDRLNPRFNAIVSRVDADLLLRQADDCDRELGQGSSRGWMHGFPLAVKDLSAVAGIPLTKGSVLLRDNRPTQDDLMVQRLKRAGAIVIGKTNTPEFGLGSQTYNRVFGTTRNAYDPSRCAGGSSGGAAVALALRMLPVADGSDMMGSLRNPAGWCNVYGMRPSWGRIPADPVGDTFMHPLATLGPMARNPRDMAAMLEVQAGPDPRVPFGLPRKSFLDGIDTEVKGRRIGWLGDWGGAYPMEAGVLDLVGDAVQGFAGLGCTVEAVPPPFSAAEIWESWVTLRAFANAGRLDPLYSVPAKRKLLKPEAIWEIEYACAAELFDTYDALVLPSAQLWPFAVDLDWPKEIAGQKMDTYHRWMEVVVPVSLIGLPSVCVPAGFGADGMAGAGLPMGMQLFGRHGDDAGLLQLAQAWHQATDWPNRKPPLL